MSPPSSPAELSAPQLRSLAALVPPSPPAAQRLTRVLHPLCDALRPKWLRDFLFTAHPLHIPHLLSPTLHATALTCRLHITTVSPDALVLYPATAPTDLLAGGYHFAGHLLYAPMFTAGHVTLGVGVIDGAGCVNVPWLGKDRTSGRVNFRFLLDGLSHTLIQVYDTPMDDLVIVFCSRLDSSTHSRNFSGYFRAGQLRESALKEDELRMRQHILPALVAFQSGVQTRPCFICDSKQPGCGCDMPIHTPQHPFDVDYFQNAMYQFVTTAEGVTSRVICNKAGKNNRRILLGCRWSLCGVREPQICVTLKDWSLSEHLNKVVFDPRKSTVALHSPASEQREQDITEIDNAVGQASVDTDMPLVVDPKSTTSHRSNASQPRQSVASASQVPHDPSAQRDFRSRPHCEQEIDAGVFPYQAISPNSDSSGRKQWWETQVDEDWSSPGGESALQNHASLPSPIVKNELNNRVERHGPGRPFEAMTRGGGVLDDAIAKERKAALRREKNRAAARKSNEKAKLRREVLKTDIEGAKARIPSLREKEMALRRENLILRRVLAGQ